MRPWSKPPETPQPVQGHRSCGKVQFAIRLDPADFALASQIAHRRGLRLGELLRGMIAAQLDAECEVSDDAHEIALAIAKEKAA